MHPMIAQTLAIPSMPQSCPAGQLPQSILPPQPLPTTPQYWPVANVQEVGVQAPESGAAPHTLEMPPPPQESGAVQLPQSSRRPQPSPIDPQYVPPTCAHVSGAQPSTGVLHTFCTHT
jgi:hypothetical protein